MFSSSSDASEISQLKLIGIGLASYSNFALIQI